MKNKTKIQLMWEVSKEQEEEFRKHIFRNFNLTSSEKQEFNDLFKLIRGTEYRRGKEEGIEEYKKENITIAKVSMKERDKQWKERLKE